MRTIAVALLSGTLVGCGARTPPAPSPRTETETTAASSEQVDVPWQTFPELCGAEAEPACVRADLALPPALLEGPVRELAALTRAMPGLETKLAARTDAGWVELPFVVEQVPPEGDARRARVVEVRSSGGVLLVRVQSATVRREGGEDVAATAHDLEENAYLCTFPAHGASCTRVRTATAADASLATASWVTERTVQLDARGRVTVSRHASR